MSKVLKMITSIMIVLLLGTLIWIFISYYNNDIKEVDKYITENSGDFTPNKGYISNNLEEEKYENIITSIITTKSGDKIVSGDIKENKNEENNIIISSNAQTSNQEKQEVLTEIDKALKGLLDAVNKVETVDEERLNKALNSEVTVP